MVKNKNTDYAVKNIIYLAVIFSTVIILIILVWFIMKPENSKDENDGNGTDILSGRAVDFPENIILGENIENLNFETKNGSKFNIEKNGKYTVLTYWASWCQYCQKQIKAMEELKDMDNVSLLIVNSLDNKRETIETAEKYLSDNGIGIQNVYDNNKTVYNSLGIKKIPTTIIISPEGEVSAVFTGTIESVYSLESVIDFVTNGYSAQTFDFIKNNMINQYGGLRTSFESDGEVPFGDDVLSESQGLLMEYAVISKNKELFDSAYRYAKEYLSNNGLFLWYYSQNADVSSNAFLDDLRIYGALLSAGDIWGEYEKEAKELESALLKYNITSNGPVDFYDFDKNKMGNSFSLCYGDLELINILEKRTGEKGLYNKVRTIIDKGYISDSFPFYYSNWNYSKKEYSKDNLNMAEAMYTLYNLSKIGELKEESEKWLLEKLNGDGIMAEYDINGNVTKGYESTGIYALAALIGMECQNDEIITLALWRLNKLRVFDISSIYNGAFGGTDGSGIYSFDQCMALKAYKELEIYTGQP